jgi:alpha-beta hydrolase superfamily lysophospholipase
MVPRPPVSTPHGDGPEPEAGELVGAAGTGIRTWRWPVEAPRGRIQLVHGLSEHLRRYIELAGVLNGAGWSVFGHDHRGHGESGGTRGVLGAFDHLVSDVERVRERADALAPGPGDPVLLGHSLGGLVVIRHLQTAMAPATRAIVSAPWLGTRVVLPMWQRIAARTLRHVLPDLVMQRGLDETKLTRDVDRGRAYRADPAVHRGGSAGLLAEVESAQAAAMADPLPEQVRMLLLLPLDDQVADPDRTRRWVASVPERQLRVVQFPKGRHEPFHDIERATVFRTLTDWLNEEAPVMASAEQTEQE